VRVPVLLIASFLVGTSIILARSRIWLATPDLHGNRP
jgi:hypothetical protein